MSDRRDNISNGVENFRTLLFSVLPYAMSGTSYAFTLPAPSALQNGVIQYAIAYIIPTRADVNVEITVGSWNEKRKVNSTKYVLSLSDTR